MHRTIIRIGSNRADTETIEALHDFVLNQYPNHYSYECSVISIPPFDHATMVNIINHMCLSDLDYDIAFIAFDGCMPDIDTARSFWYCTIASNSALFEITGLYINRMKSPNINSIIEL